MSDETRLLQALEESGIRRIAVVDDAFDLPEIPEGEWGTIRAHLISQDFQDALAHLPDIQALYPQAIESIEGNELDSDDLIKFQRLAFAQYVDTRDANFDLGRQFSRMRADSLDAVQPILTLLARANTPVEVTKIGSMQDEDFAERIADIDLVFADFYLDPSVTPEDSPEDKRSQDAKAKSQEMIAEIITARGKVPSIVLMSSKDVGALATEFRKGIAASSGQVVSARFQFVEKNQLSVTTSGAVEIKEKASDVLLDLLQTFKFSEGVSVAIELWKTSAKEAITATAEAISELEVRDFAYLIRFRLEKEGQELVEYMEWLLGEYLIDETARRFYSGANNLPVVREVAHTQGTVEGAYDGQSQRVGNIYHRVKVEDVRPGRAHGFRMGDMYLDKDGKKISAVITPDCDLVMREGKRRASRFLLVNGLIKAFDRKNTSAAEFILINGAGKNIEWHKKDIESQSFEWSEEAAERTWIGTLRPMYAQQLQRAVLHDVGRVGLAPWPALYVDAEVELRYYDSEKKICKLNFNVGAAKTAIVMPKRPDAEKEKHSVVFERSLIRAVRKTLMTLPPETILEAGRVHHASLSEDNGDVGLSRHACAGVDMETFLPHSIFLSNQEKPAEANWAWLTVRVSK